MFFFFFMYINVMVDCVADQLEGFKWYVCVCWGGVGVCVCATGVSEWMLLTVC